MTQLVNILRNNKISIIYICFILILFFMIFFLKMKIEKEPDFNKRINKKFILKYVIMCMLIIGMILVISSYILAIKFIEMGFYLITGSFVFLFVTVEWAFIFDRINIYSDFSKDNIVKQYISFFAKKEMSSFKYLDIITWFSRWNHKYFRSRDNNQEIDQLIIKLELCLRPCYNGLCLASRHKNVFLHLCDKIKYCQFEEQLKLIENVSREMENNPPEKYRIFSLGLERNILIYMSILILHVVASILIDGGIKNIIGNILFYIPSDVLVILVYKGIINEKEDCK